MSVSGASVAAGLKKLSMGGNAIDVSSTKILAAFQQLASGKSIEAIGTFASLEWDARGAPLGGRVEVWCIASGTPSAAFASSDLSMDLKTMKLDGSYVQCDAEVVASPAAATRVVRRLPRPASRASVT